MSDYRPKIGDLIRDKEFPEDMGIVIEIHESSYNNHYRVVSTNGIDQWLPRDYIEGECEVMCASR
jgi:hypothetical protein